MFTHPQHYLHRYTWHGLFSITNFVRNTSITFFLIPLWCLMFLTLASPSKFNPAPASVTQFSAGSSPPLRASLPRCSLWTPFPLGCILKWKGRVSCILGHGSWRAWIRSCWWWLSTICGDLVSAGGGEAGQKCAEWRQRQVVGERVLSEWALMVANPLSSAVSLLLILLTSSVFLTYPLDT